MLRSLRDFFADDGIILAAALAFFTMLVAVPFLIFLVSLTGYFLGEHAVFYKFFFSKFTYYFPTGTERMARIFRNLTYYKKVGLFGILLYGFLSYGLFRNLEKAMNRIFKVKKGRHLLLSVFFSFLMISVIGILTLLSFIFSDYEPILAFFGKTLSLGRAYSLALKYLVPVSLLLAISTAVYKFLPAKKVSFRNALRGGLFTSVMFEAAKQIFAFYIKSIPLAGSIYGSLSAIWLFLLWVFYSSCILLIGGEIVHNMGEGGGRR